MTHNTAILTELKYILAECQESPETLHEATLGVVAIRLRKLINQLEKEKI